MRRVILPRRRGRFSVLSLVLLLGVVILPSFQPAPAAQTPADGAAEPSESIGLRVRAISGLLPIGTFRVGTDVQQPAFGFSAGGDISYRLPIDAVGIDVGVGSKYNFERIVAGQGGAAYSTIPLYVLVGLPFSLPDIAIFEIFLEGRIGYSFFLVNDAFRNNLLNGNDPEGDLYWAIGIGAQLDIVPSLFASVAINYGSGGGKTATTTITNETFDIEIGLGYTF